VHPEESFGLELTVASKKKWWTVGDKRDSRSLAAALQSHSEMILDNSGLVHCCIYPPKKPVI